MDQFKRGLVISSAVWCAGLIFFTVLMGLRLDEARAAKHHTRWEYLRLRDTGITADLNVHGDQGWELVSSYNGLWYLKRPR